MVETRYKQKNNNEINYEKEKCFFSRFIKKNSFFFLFSPMINSDI